MTSLCDKNSNLLSPNSRFISTTTKTQTNSMTAFASSPNLTDMAELNYLNTPNQNVLFNSLAPSSSTIQFIMELNGSPGSMASNSSGSQPSASQQTTAAAQQGSQSPKQPHAPTSVNNKLHAASVKKLKKILGAETPDILHAKNLTERYAELLPNATMKGNAQVKLVLSTRPSSLSSSSPTGMATTSVTWQPAFLAVVRRTLHIFLLSRPQGHFVPAEIALPLFAFSLEYQGGSSLASIQAGQYHHPSMPSGVMSASSSSSSSSLVYHFNDPTVNVQTFSQAGQPQTAGPVPVGSSMPPPGKATTSQPSRPYIVLKPSIVGGGVHEALALDWDPMAWEYWILIDSDQDHSQWIDCLRQVQRTTSHLHETAGHPIAPTTASKMSRSGRNGKQFNHAAKDDLALSDPKSTSESTRRIINDLKRWKMRIGNRSIKFFQPPSQPNKSNNPGDTPGESLAGAGASGDASAASGTDKQPPAIFLASCEPSTTNQYVPAVVELCVAVIEARGLDTVGVYRVTGNIAAVTDLWDTVVVQGIENVNADDPRWSDIHIVGSLLKTFFRKLSEPLFPYNVYHGLMSANRQSNGERRMLSLKRLIHQLPPHHYETLRFLAKHLQGVAANSSRNKMDISNLAIVFGPTLVRARIHKTPSGAIGGPTSSFKGSDGKSSGDNTSTPNPAMNDIVKDTSDQCRIVQTIVKHVDWFFAGWEADSQVPFDETSPNANDSKAPGIDQLAASGSARSVPLSSLTTASALPPSMAKQVDSAPGSNNGRSPSSSSPRDFVSNILSSARNFRRKSDNQQLPSNRNRVVSEPPIDDPDLTLESRRTAGVDESGIFKQNRSMSLFAQSNNQPRVPGKAVRQVTDPSNSIGEEEHDAESDTKLQFSKVINARPDGVYSAQLTYVEGSVASSVAQHQQQCFIEAQPPTPPTSSHVHPVRRAPNLVTVRPQQHRKPQASASIVPPPVFMVRSMSLDSIDVFSLSNNNTIMHPKTSNSADSHLQLSQASFAGAPSDWNQQVPLGGSDNLDRLQQLEEQLRTLQAAEEDIVKEAYKYNSQRVQLQAEFERLLSAQQSQVPSGRTQARF